MQYDEDPLLEGRCYNLSYSLKNVYLFSMRAPRAEKI